MKIYINRTPKNGPWGGGNLATREIFDHMVKNDLTCKNQPPDVLLVLGLEQEDGNGSLEQCLQYKLKNKGSKLIIRVNDCDARKATSYVDDRFLAASQFADGTIFVSKWMQDYFVTKGWDCKKNVVIVNGVDQEIFKPNVNHKLQDSRISIITHHWSNNKMKGSDYTEWLDAFVEGHREHFKYTFIGRTNVQLKNSKHISPLWGQELGHALSINDVCINASRYDPGPNSTLESISCGLPTYVHSDGGGSVEFAGTDHTFSSFSDLEKILLSKQYKKNDFNIRSWKQFTNDVFSFINEVVNE